MGIKPKTTKAVLIVSGLSKKVNNPRNDTAVGVGDRLRL
jgi:hypothetical protein